MLLSVTIWLLLAVRVLWRYPSIAVANQERESRLAARVGLGMLDCSLAWAVLLLCHVVPKFFALYADLGASLPHPTVLTLDLHRMLSGPWALVMFAGLAGLLPLHSRLLNRHGWRSARAMLAVCSVLSAVLVLWIPVSLWLPMRCLHSIGP